jgi:retron-type reverse transcriptase
LTKCFDSFEHKLLIKKVEARIKDQVLIDLLWKALKAGHIDSSRFIHKASIGTPQGSLISPVLCNIYLTALDQWVENYQKVFRVGERKQANPVYTKLIRGMGYKALAEKMAIRKKINREGIRPTLANEVFRRLYYVRYADDFVIAIHGSINDAQAIKKDLQDFIRDE